MSRPRNMGFIARVLTAIGAVSLAISTLMPSWGSQGSCVMPTTGTVSGLTLVNDINACNDAILSVYSGAVAPGSPVTGMLWLNSGSGLVSQYDGSVWNGIWTVDATNHLTLVQVGGGTASVSSAGTTNLGAAPQFMLTITGTNTITSFGSSAPQGTAKLLTFAAGLQITYNATSLILPGSANITTVANDSALAVSLGGGNWRVITYTRADGTAVRNPSVQVCTKIDYMGFSSGLNPSYVLALGQAISRAAFPDYFACATTVVTANTTSASNIVTGLSDATELAFGMPVEGANIQAGTTVTSVDSGTQIHISLNATGTGTPSLRFFAYGYGAGGDTTTVGVPKCDGRKIVGRDQGGSILAGAQGLGAIIGSQSHTMSLAELVAHSHTGGGTTSGQSVGHTHDVGSGTGTGNMSGYASVASGSPTITALAAQAGGSPYTATTGAGSADHSHTYSFTTSTVGSTTPFSIVDPTMAVNCAIRVLP